MKTVAKVVEVTAEEQWIEWCTSTGNPDYSMGATQGIEAYKSALRKAIEESISNIKSVIEQFENNGQYGNENWYSAKSQLWTLEYVLGKLDTVNPEKI
jgi:hypothetical protein